MMSCHIFTLIKSLQVDKSALNPMGENDLYNSYGNCYQFVAYVQMPITEHMLQMLWLVDRMENNKGKWPFYSNKHYEA